MTEDSTVLPGGGDHHGEVRRAGDTVVRPTGPHSATVHAFLRHLKASAFDGAPRVVSLSPDKEVLSFIVGEVPAPPEPPADGWVVVPDEQARSVGALLARFHRAARTFSIPAGAHWKGGFTPGLRHTVVCHNDPVVGNVVFRDGYAVALIDFDFAGPNDPLRDLAIAVQHWVPLGDPSDLLGASGSSPFERLDATCRAYGLPATRRGRLLDLVDSYLERGRDGVSARVRAGDGRFVAYWAAGLGDRLTRALVWLRRERASLMRGVT